MKKLSLLLTLAASLGLASTSRAADNTWDNIVDEDFLWNGFNWSGPLLWADGDNAIFGPVGIGSITNSGTRTVHDMTFNSPGYSVTGGTLILDAPTPTIRANADVTISSILAGSSGLTLEGNSTLNIRSGNSYTGGTYVRGGTLNLKTPSGYGADRIEAVDAGATVKLGTVLAIVSGTNFYDRAPNGQIPQGNKLNLTGGILDVNGDDNQNTIPLISGTGTVINSSELARAVLKMNGSGVNTFSGQIMDGGPVTNGLIGGKLAHRMDVDFAGGNGTLVLAGSNSFTGFFRTGGSPTVRMSGAGTLGYPTSTDCPARQLLLNGGLLDLNGTSQKVGVAFAGSSVTIANNATGTVSILTVCFNATNLTVPGQGGLIGTIKDNTGVGGKVGLTKDGVAIQAVSGSHTYSGDTTVLNGILRFDAASAVSPNTTMRLSTSQGVLQLNYLGAADVVGLYLNGISQPNGVYSNTTPPITGTGAIRVVGNPLIRIIQAVKAPEADQLTLTWYSLPGAAYSIESTSTILGNALTNWVPEDTGIPSGGPTTTRTISTGPGIFYRIRKE